MEKSVFSVAYGMLVWFVIISSLSGCKKYSMKEVEKIASQSAPNVEYGTGIEMLYTENGKPVVRITAPEAERHLDKPPYMEFPAGIKLYVYDRFMNVESTLTAEYGYAKEDRQEMIAKDNVEVVNVDGDTLRTQELIWDQKKDLIYSNTFVEIRTKDEIIYGEGLEADQNFTNYKIKKITGSIEIQNDKENTENP